MNTVLLALLAWLAWVSPQTAGGLRVETPPGWRQLENPQTGVVNLIPPNLPPGKDCAIMIFPAQETAATAQAVLDQLLDTYAFRRQ